MLGLTKLEKEFSVSLFEKKKIQAQYSFNSSENLEVAIDFSIRGQMFFVATFPYYKN